MRELYLFFGQRRSEIRQHVSSSLIMDLQRSQNVLQLAQQPQGLTLSQMTNFRLFQTERVCRQQFQIWEKWQIVLQMGRKHCGKRRNCSLRAISPFPTLFSKILYCRNVKTRACFGKVYESQTGEFVMLYWNATRVKRTMADNRTMPDCFSLSVLICRGYETIVFMGKPLEIRSYHALGPSCWNQKQLNPKWPFYCF